ncbi:MAG: urease accessory protein UreD [Aphanocapsa feldmannii 288cV]|nr:MAG: urease accessory protein UreD [Aphanocapsa feldmannii 288cV]
MAEQPGWLGTATLVFSRRGRGTVHQGGATAPLKLQRGYDHGDGRWQLPLLHTAGGLVGGDQLAVDVRAGAGSQALITTVAAQKIYGSVGRSRQVPEGRWSRQSLHMHLAEAADLEWMPQETILFDAGLFEQHCLVELARDAVWLGVEVVRLGCTAAGQRLNRGEWRSRLEVWRGEHPLLIDPQRLSAEGRDCPHGMDTEPVYGALVWAGVQLPDGALLERCRSDRRGLAGTMVCDAIGEAGHAGLICRYRGPSTVAARFWFARVWARLRAFRQLPPPALPRVWPFQENPLLGAS